ncbi:PAS domain-containing protein [Pseudooceanicola sp. 502str34]
MDNVSSLPSALAQYLNKSTVALALSETGGDTPLVLVNDAFCKLTGYDADDVLNRNCRFLQGPETTEETRRALGDFVRGQGPDQGRFPILNYRKDGTTFHNYVFMTRLKDNAGRTRYILASQFDITTALMRSKLRANDEKLRRALTDVEQIGRESGLAMMESAKLLADSVAVMAQLSLRDTET